MLSLIFLVLNAHSVSLLQEEKEILCESNSSKVLEIEKKDDYFSFDNIKYDSVEFLDTAILAKNDKSYALLQTTQNNKALLIKGDLYDLEEENCKDTGASKTCSTESFKELYWSSSVINFTQNKNKNAMKVIRYGVYPNDGTYFIARKDSTGLALIDYGSKLQIIHGKITSFSCNYK